MYRNVKCPRCKKRFFQKMPEATMFLSLYIVKEEPIYKNGKLQNPETKKPTKTRFKCLECGCYFRVEQYNLLKYKIVDEDAELEEKEQRLKEQRQKLKEQHEKSAANSASPTDQDIVKSDSENAVLTITKSSIGKANNSVELDFETRLKSIESRLVDLEKKTDNGDNKI